MIIIAHRGNLKGDIPQRENHPDYIDEAIMAGFPVEVDIWGIDRNKLLLGHTGPLYEISLDWLIRRKNSLWLHTKNADAVHQLSLHTLTWFPNYRDEFSILSNGFILHWSKDRNLIRPNHNYLIPLIEKEDIDEYPFTNHGATVTNYPLYCQRKYTIMS